jgi:2-keto-4-pentenoate hydratase/2-oxohepta-3-ene-1,7-dioic acid hydratase in catechol pathway
MLTMRLLAFKVKDGQGPPEVRFGALLAGGDEILECRLAIGLLEHAAPASRPSDLLSWFDLDGPWLSGSRQACTDISRDPDRLSQARRAGAVLRRDAVEIVAPVPRPGKVVCVGLNYRDHAAESKMPVPERPVLFSKFPTAVIGPDQPIEIPFGSSRVDYEAELAVVIGRRAKLVPVERALEYVLGYTNFNDVSARDFQFADGQWQRGKSCDTFAPFGPAIVTADEIADPHTLRIRARVNGQTLQDSNTNQLVFGVPELIAFISETITLEPGDVIATGTPPGVGFARNPPIFLQPGDVVEIEVEGLGVLSNPVVATAMAEGHQVS